MNVDYVGNGSVACSHSPSQHSLPLLAERGLYGNWLCNPHFNCCRVMRSVNAVRNSACFVCVLDYVHPWVLYYQNQWNDAKKKKNHPLISQLLCYTCISPSSPARLYKACCSLVPEGYNLYMGAEKNDGRFWTDLKSHAPG